MKKSGAAPCTAISLTQWLTRSAPTVWWTFISKASFSLVPDAVHAGDQHRIEVLRLVDREQPAEAADLAQHALGEGLVGEILDALLGAVGLVDIYARIGVSDGFGRVLGHCFSVSAMCCGSLLRLKKTVKSANCSTVSCKTKSIHRRVRREDLAKSQQACLIHENESYVFWGLFFGMESDCESASREFWERGIDGEGEAGGFSSTAPQDSEWTKMGSGTRSSRQLAVDASATSRNRVLKRPAGGEVESECSGRCGVRERRF